MVRNEMNFKDISLELRIHISKSAASFELCYDSRLNYVIVEV